MAQVTITPENSSWTSTAGAQTGTVEGVTVAVTNGVTGSTTAEGATMRIYKDATLTISSASNITKIVFNCVANNTTKYGPGCFGAQEGYSYDAKVGTWEGSATSVSFTASSAQVRATSIVVTLAEGGDTPVDPGDEPVVEPAVLITFGDSAVDKGAWSNGAVIADKDSLVKLTLVDPDAKIAIDLSDANFGTTEEYVSLKSRLKTGGKSSSSKNYINVEVAKDGQLYIMARTGSNSATDRNVVITNGTDTIFNQLLLESNATEVSLDDATSMKIYPVYSASLNAGVTYRISYPVNGVNFYGFDFVAEEEPVVGPQNLGAKTIAEFLALKNTTDTCILTGVVSNITNTTYGNFDLCDATDTVYIYGLLTSAGESKKFADLNVAEKDTLTLLAIYNEYNGKPQAKNAIFVEVKKYVEPVAEHTYTIAGSPATLFGTAWDPTNAANDMKPITGSKYLYAWEKDSVALTAGDIEFKVCEDHAWTKAWPAQNYKLNIAEAGLYKVSIFFNPEFGDSAVYAMAEKKGEAKVLPNIILHGNFTGTWADTDPFVAAQDSLTASLTLALAAGNYEFGFKFDGTWKANGANLTREDNTANLSTGEGNMHITADVPGNYVFTYTYETQGVVVTYPEPIIVPDTIDVTMSSLTAPGSLIWDDEVATEGWWQIMGGNDTCAFSLSNGNQITTAAGTYTVDDLDAKYSYLTIVKANDTIEVAFVDGSITVAVDEVGVVTVVGALLGNDGNVYKFNLTYVEPKAETTVNVNIAEGKMNDVYAGYGLYGVYGTDTTANVFVQLAIWAEDGFQGNFTEKDLDFKYVGSGIVEGLTAPRIYTAAITVTPGNLEGEYSITADLLCYNNTLYKVTMTISAAQGIDAVEAATKAIKSLQNGILTIEKAGKTYNVNGTLIR